MAARAQQQGSTHARAMEGGMNQADKRPEIVFSAHKAAYLCSYCCSCVRPSALIAARVAALRALLQLLACAAAALRLPLLLSAFPCAAFEHCIFTSCIFTSCIFTLLSRILATAITAPAAGVDLCRAKIVCASCSLYRFSICFSLRVALHGVCFCF